MKNKIHEEEITGILFLIAAVCFYISAIMGFIGTDGGSGVTNLCLGSAFLCLSFMHLSKGRDKDEKNR